MALPVAREGILYNTAPRGFQQWHAALAAPGDPARISRRLYKSTPGCFEHAVSGQRAVLDPQPLSRQQRLTLIGVDPSLQCLVGCIQPLIRSVSFACTHSTTASVEVFSPQG